MSITIYSKADCPWCERAKQMLSLRGIPFEEEVLYRDFDIKFINDNFPSMKTFPVIVENTRLIGGYDSLIKEIIDDPSFGKIIISE